MQKIIVLVVLCLLLYPQGVFGQNQEQDVVATVRGDTITVADFQVRARLQRWQLINNLNNLVQFYRNQGYCSDTISGGVANQEPYITWILDLQDSHLMGIRVLGETIDELILRQEAKIRKIDVSPEEIQAEFNAFMGLAAAQDSATLTPSQIDYNQQMVNSVLDDLRQNADITESDFRAYLSNLALRHKFEDIIGKDLLPEQQPAALNEWLQNLEVRARDKIKVLDIWHDFVPISPVLIWPPVDTVEPIPVPSQADVLAYADKITFNEIYRHPSGVFIVGIPLGWTTGEPVTDPKTGGADISFLNSTERSIIQVTAQHTDDAITTFEALSAFFSPEKLAASWINYRCALEVSRQEDGDKLILDFRLHSETKTYIARQIAWANDRWNYSIRVVTLADRADLLEYLLNSLLETFAFTGTT